jgi:Putative  PD-(D/E)XK family member, (DUF4420)
VTPDEYQTVWRGLGLPTSGNQLEATEIPLGSGIWVARDHRGGQHLLVRVPDGAKLALSETHGLSVSITRTRIPDQGDASYVDLACLDAAAAPTFAAVASDIAAAAFHVAPERRVSAVTAALGEWRWFWGVDPARLSGADAVGLFGELWFLVRWAKPSAATVESWRGPDGARHDFQWPDLSVEVKATSRSGPVVHTIQHLQQLEDPEQGVLYLFSLRLARDSLAANTLNSLVEVATSTLASQPQARADLQAKLGQRGYTPASKDVSAVAYRVVEEALYAVRGGFPRLTRASFGAGLPRGIVTVSYQLDMAACHDWRLGASADSWPPTYSE